MIAVAVLTVNSGSVVVFVGFGAVLSTVDEMLLSGILLFDLFASFWLVLPGDDNACGELEPVVDFVMTLVGMGKLNNSF